MNSSFYPIKCKLIASSGERVVDILQVSHNGLVVDSEAAPLAVNKTYQAIFEFFISKTETYPADVTVVVYRTYGEVLKEPVAGRKIRHVNELVFKKPSRAFNESLIKFLANVSNRAKG